MQITYRQGTKAMVRLLIDKGIDVDFRRGEIDNGLVAVL